MAVYLHQGSAGIAVPYDDRALIAASIWMRLGFVGLLACGGAVAELAQGWAHALEAIALFAAGSCVLFFSWRRVSTILGFVDERAAAADAPRRDSAGLAAGRGWSARHLPDSSAAA